MHLIYSGFPSRNRAHFGVDLSKSIDITKRCEYGRLTLCMETHPSQSSQASVEKRATICRCEHLFIGQIGMKCFKMYHLHARCQKTFWQMKTHQSCLDLASYSSGLVWGNLILKIAVVIRLQIWGVWRARLSWRSALSYFLHTTDLDCKWTRVLRESGAKRKFWRGGRKVENQLQGERATSPLYWSEGGGLYGRQVGPQRF